MFRARFNIFLLLLFVTGWGFSQSKKIFGLSYYSASSISDLSEYKNWNSGLAVGLTFDKDKRLTSELETRIGTLVLQNTSTLSPVVAYVKTNYFSFNYNLKIKVLELGDKFSFSLVPGFGIMRYNPKDEQKNALSGQKNTRAKDEQYGNVTLILPVRFQFEYLSKHRLSYRLSTGFLNTRTDYLDNLSKLSNSKNKDNVFFMSLGVGVHF
jgi:hypothetical protein